MDTLTLKGYAKINLGLDVIRRLENGYHELQMIMQSVSLCDVVTLHKIPENQIQLTCSDSSLPCDETNLAYKAAKLMKDTYSINSGISIHIEKNIPMAAGMAGGSTDCAAVLKGMNTLFDLKASSFDLEKLGVTLGADVPFCIDGGCKLSEGIGEILTPIERKLDCFVLLATPDISVPTGPVFGALTPEIIADHPNIPATMDALTAGDLPRMCALLDNTLEKVTASLHPEIPAIEKEMCALGAVGALMSGSGPTVFGLFTHEEKAKEAAQKLSAKFSLRGCHVASFV